MHTSLFFKTFTRGPGCGARRERNFRAKLRAGAPAEIEGRPISARAQKAHLLSAAFLAGAAYPVRTASDPCRCSVSRGKRLIPARIPLMVLQKRDKHGSQIAPHCSICYPDGSPVAGRESVPTDLRRLRRAGRQGAVREHNSDRGPGPTIRISPWPRRAAGRRGMSLPMVPPHVTVTYDMGAAAAHDRRDGPTVPQR